MLSFGATKNGALGVEAVVFFDRALADDFLYRRKRAGQLVSKSRYLGAQMLAYLDDDLWLTNARHANAMADRLAAGLRATPGRAAAAAGRAPTRCSPSSRGRMHERAAGRRRALSRRGRAKVRAPLSSAGDEVFIRLLTSFRTTERRGADVPRARRQPRARRSPSLAGRLEIRQQVARALDRSVSTIAATAASDRRSAATSAATAGSVSTSHAPKASHRRDGSPPRPDASGMAIRAARRRRRSEHVDDRT